MIFGLQYGGVRFALDIDGDRWPDLQPYLPPEREPAPLDGARLYRFERRFGSRWQVVRGDEVLCPPTALLDAANWVEGDLSVYLADHAVDRILVHAGVVGWRGRAILAPARTMGGKSHLVEYLVRQGAEYYSDEYAALDSAGRVHPWPRWLSLRSRGRTRRVDPRTLGSIGREPLPVGLVLLTRFAAGATFRPRTVGPGAAVLEVLRHTLPARTRPQESLRTLRETLATALVWKGQRGDMADVAPRLLSQWS